VGLGVMLLIAAAAAAAAALSDCSCECVLGYDVTTLLRTKSLEVDEVETRPYRGFGCACAQT